LEQSLKSENFMGMDLRMQEGEAIEQAHDICSTVNIFHQGADNVGDRLCGPAQFFWPDRVMNVGFIYQLTKPENAILGGGQVFGQIAQLSERLRDNPTGALVAWGVGLPLKGRQDARVQEVADRFSLFGTRNYEWRESLRFVPCASCMSPEFDAVPEPKHDVVIYAHRKKTPDLTPVAGVPFMTNSEQDAARAIRFIAEGETVVTSSYHGVYWAQLLGRKVICIPYNDKFSTFQHEPAYATAQTWKAELGLATRTVPLLDIYREINIRFAAEAAEVLGLNG